MGIAGRIDRTTVVGSNDHAAYRGIVIADILDCWVGIVFQSVMPIAVAQ